MLINGKMRTTVNTNVFKKHYNYYHQGKSLRTTMFQHRTILEPSFYNRKIQINKITCKGTHINTRQTTCLFHQFAVSDVQNIHLTFDVYCKEQEAPEFQEIFSEIQSTCFPHSVALSASNKVCYESGHRHCSQSSMFC